MIRSSIDERGISLSTAFPAGSVSYVDRDWIPAAEGRVHSITVSPDRSVLWCEHDIGRIPDQTAVTAVVAAVLVAVADQAVDAARSAGPGRVEVIGSGLIAASARRLIASGSHSTGERVAAIVDATGNPDSIRWALDRVSELGTVVLAGRAAGRRLDVDLFSSVHRRGLVVVGVAPLLDGVDVAAIPSLTNADIEWSERALAEAAPGARVHDGALWYRILG